MKVLIVANHNTGNYSPFIVEQVNALKKKGISFDFFGIHGKGISGYLSNLNALKSKIQEYHPDIIHAHYGLSGLLANLQRNVPVVTTYHGSDIHSGRKLLFFSKQSMNLSAYNIFVSEWLLNISGYHGHNKCVIPCGVDMTTFHPIDRLTARQQMGWDINGKYVLFSSAFDNEVKNYPLAKAAVEKLDGIHLIELQGYDREHVNLAFNASNCLLMTSFREGSPQVIKEALACGTPIVSVGVSDVAKTIEGVEGCYIVSNEPTDIANNLTKAIEYEGKTLGRQHILDLELSNEHVANKVLQVYNQIMYN